MSAGFRSLIAGVLGRFVAPVQSGTGIPPLGCEPMDFDLAVYTPLLNLVIEPLNMDLAVPVLNVYPVLSVQFDLLIRPLDFSCGE